MMAEKEENSRSGRCVHSGGGGTSAWVAEGRHDGGGAARWRTVVARIPGGGGAAFRNINGIQILNVHRKYYKR